MCYDTEKWFRSILELALDFWGMLSMRVPRVTKCIYTYIYMHTHTHTRAHTHTHTHTHTQKQQGPNRSRDITLLTKVCTRSVGLSSSHVWMWELDYKDGWKCYLFSHVQFFVTHGLKFARLLFVMLQARILWWVAIPFSRGSSWDQGLNLGLLHCRQILYCLSHQESPMG